MAIEYSRVPVKDPELDKVQTEIKRSFQSIPVPATSSDGIVRVDTASGTRTYAVKDTDQHIVGITNGGPLTISLPSPAIKRTLGVIGSGANKVTVQRSDGKAMSFGSSKELQDAASLFTSDGTDWYLG